ncbi:tRNA lysidine(34) synthetase TilS [Clostridiaceae bacterium UIB06]|uniref:tRNA(Ile)-lysidine synthase n=1 Tax=Clostridium thailandense TaxID=2794346 RepID=A0A949TZ86_9CLOT|nr:tRNA lysidine(34) synthetase TilS [Clostridium thailandense]MBV7276386.1 tRNA lysidine(34) synthetase TilS [Clostridium thailandense]MCH5137359.1 tRNA lysidine(34) synthetase TilS [Clostridiaceae bacterium UIB06]
MIESVLKTIRTNNMFSKGDKVIVAVSGGPDSICLLHILYALKDELQITLYAAHVNHCLRGEEANEDELYVKRFCENLNIEFRSKRVDINQMAETRKMSSETAGREARYEFFYDLKKEFKAQKIAIAHNANDQAETVLMRIMRGTGMEGLIGIRPVRDNIFVRPLIRCIREDIEKYCSNNNLNPRIDKTNLEPIYARNKIRVQLIPYMKKNFNENIIEVLNRLSNVIKVDNDYLEDIAKEKYKKYCDINKEKVIISKEAFLENEAIIARIIRLALYDVSSNLYNFERIHIYDVLDIQRHSTGKMLMLPNKVCVKNNYGNIVICKKQKDNPDETYSKYILNNGLNELKDVNLKVTLELTNNSIDAVSERETFIKYFDYDKIKGDISIRYRKDGDRFTPLGMRGSKKLKDLFIDLKIPRDERDEIPLICFNDEIAWIVNYRISELFKVDKNTKRILKIIIESEEA